MCEQLLKGPMNTLLAVKAHDAFYYLTSFFFYFFFLAYEQLLKGIVYPLVVKAHNVLDLAYQKEWVTLW